MILGVQAVTGTRYVVTLLGHLPCLTHQYILRKPSEYSEIIVEPLFRNFINLVVL